MLYFIYTNCSVQIPLPLRPPGAFSNGSVLYKAVFGGRKFS